MACRRTVGVAYTSTPFSFFNKCIVIDTVDTYPLTDYNNNLIMCYNVKDKLINKCKNKDECFETMILKNYPFIKVYLREILNEILEPFILNKTIQDGYEIIITGLDKIDDNVINMYDIILENNKYLYHEHGINLKHTMVVSESERF